tara:strand:- start:32 stop:169 length:138 start_codon:yes stop_codon:yes gene_type:complete
MNEYEWRFSGRVSQIDLMYWGRLHKIRNRLEKNKTITKKGTGEYE